MAARSKRILVPTQPAGSSAGGALPELQVVIEDLKLRLFATSDFGERLQEITDAVVRIFGADFARFWLVQEADLCASGCRHATVTEGAGVCRDRTRCLHLMASSGRYTHTDGEHGRVPLGCGPIGQLASGEDRRLVINDLASNERLRDRTWAASLGLSALAGCRLAAADGSPVGVLSFFRTRAVGPAELDLLEALAGSTLQVVLMGKAQQGLRESEERYRQLVDSLPVAVAVHSGGGLVFANPEALRTLRVPSLDTVIGRPILDFVHPDDRPLVMQRVAAAYQSKIDGPIARERFVRLDGEVFDVEVLVRAVTYQERPAGQVVFWDVTERKRAEEALSASETRWRVLGENAPAFIMMLDAEGRILSLNRAFPGRTVAELLGTSVYDYPSFADAKKVRAVLAAVFERRERIEYEASYVRRDGTTVWLLNDAAPVEQDGRVVAAIHVSIDISARKRAEEERNRFFDLSLDMLCVASVDGYLKELNPAWTAALGWKLEELRSRPWLDFVHPDDVQATTAAGERLKRGERVTLFVNRYRCSDGSYRRLSWNSVAVPKEGLIFAVVRDVTDRLRLEEQLRQAEKMTALGQLAGGVAHDFNNQLAGILGYGELLRERAGDDETLRRYAEGIVTGAQRSARLTQQLLAFARKGKYQVVPVDLHDILDEVRAILEHSIDKRITIRRAFSTTPIQVLGDPTQLQNALLNLAINGRDAMPDGGTLELATGIVTVDRPFQQVSHLELAPGPYACIRISDTGVGMDEGTRRRALEPFFTTKGPGYGTGLGLSAAYGIVRNHLGALRLDSARGRGTRVEVFLPLAEQAPKADTHGPPAAKASSLRILLVDDEDLVRTATTEMLKALGHTVRACKDGREAVEVFSASPASYDLVIMDMIMPFMSGSDALARMRTVKPKLRAILASGYSLDDEAQRLLGQGSLCLIQKPFTISELAGVIAQAEKTEA